MSCTLQGESEIEHSFLIEYEYSDSVIEFWDQPEPVTVERSDGKQSITAPYTADVLLLTRAGPRAIQIKSEDELCKLVAEEPTHWIRNESGYQFVPAETSFFKYGIQHEVHSSALLNPIRQSNLRLLLTTREQEYRADESLNAAIDRAFRSTSILTLQHLADELSMIDVTPLLQLLDRELLFGNLDRYLLGLRGSALIARYPALLDIFHDDSTHTILAQPAVTAETTKIRRVPSEAAAKRGLELLSLIKNNSTDREVYRVKSRMKDRIASGFSRLEAACPNYGGRGNRTKRVSEDHEQFIVKAINTFYASEKKPTMRQAHIAYMAQIQNDNAPFHPVAEPTFRERILRVDPPKLAYKRGGRRMRNAAAPPTPISSRGTVPLFAGERCSIDHTLLSLAVVIAKTANGKNITAKLWVTAMVDHFTKMILAIWISFKAPSKQCVAMTIRRCSKTFGFIPRIIYGDGGSALTCGYLQQLCAYYGSTWIQHEQASGRSGGEIERVFAYFETEWLPYRAGNLKNISSRRAISSSHSPESSATLTIHEVWQELKLFVDWNSRRTIGDMPEPPVVLMDQSLAAFPTVPAKAPYNDDLIFRSAVDCRNFALDRTRGIHINNRWFVHPKLFDPAFTKSSVQVRIEPENPYKIFVKLNDDWIVCLARGHDEFLQLDEHERHVTSFRLILGESYRDEARIANKVDLVARLLTLDEQKKAAEKGVATPTVVKTRDPDKPNQTLFEEVRNIALEPIEVSQPNEVINNVLAFRINSYHRGKVGSPSQDDGSGGGGLHGAVDSATGGDHLHGGTVTSREK
jgi:hypothetical protein